MNTEDCPVCRTLRRKVRGHGLMCETCAKYLRDDYDSFHIDRSIMKTGLCFIYIYPVFWVCHLTFMFCTRGITTFTIASTLLSVLGWVFCVCYVYPQAKLPRTLPAYRKIIDERLNDLFIKRLRGGSRVDLDVEDTPG